MLARQTVIEKLLAGWKHPQGTNMAFNDALADWHGDKKFIGACSEYMGLTQEEYDDWKFSRRSADEILEKRKTMVP